MESCNCGNDNYAETPVVNRDVLIGKVSPIQQTVNSREIYKQPIHCLVHSEKFPTTGDMVCHLLCTENH